MGNQAPDDDLSDLIKSDNGCLYTDLLDNVIDTVSVWDNSKINILHLNIRSLIKNIDNLLLLLNDLQECGIVIHVIGICESFLSHASESLAQLENY